MENKCERCGRKEENLFIVPLHLIGGCSPRNICTKCAFLFDENRFLWNSTRKDFTLFEIHEHNMKIRPSNYSFRKEDFKYLKLKYRLFITKNHSKC